MGNGIFSLQGRASQNNVSSVCGAEAAGSELAKVVEKLGSPKYKNLHHKITPMVPAVLPWNSLSYFGWEIMGNRHLTYKRN